MFGLTPLGIVHTALSLVAVASGAIALLLDKRIDNSTRAGKIYIVSTLIVCLSGFGIFQHGGFGKAHVLGILTLLVLGMAFYAGKSTQPLGKFSEYISTIAYTATFFFHLIPGITETATRLPLSAPWASGPDDPKIQMGIGICFILTVLVILLQVRALKKKTLV